MYHRPQFLCAITVVCTAIASADERLDFQRDIRPILSDACFHCHGPDGGTREADLRLDQEEGLKSHLVPGRPSESELIRRILSEDDDEVMPPPDSGKKLTASQSRLITAWVKQGGEWTGHWSFQPPRKVQPPLNDRGWGRNAIDSFVIAKLRTEGLQPSDPASQRTLARRVSLDLTGLSPTRAELDAFLSDETPDAYDRYVNRLLDSRMFGQRMAMVWLDAARYADTDGFQADSTRNNWPWRDWVVDAYNTNLPFDEFTIQQFAGDLLPNATPEQVLATCFHRNHMTNGEGGRDPEESRVDYVIDRVNTMGTVLLGLTLGCAQCHNHKYDPISQTEYYQLNAFFNSIDEDGSAGSGAKPYLKYQSKQVADGLSKSRSWLRRVNQELEQIETYELGEFENWLSRYVRSIQTQGGHESWRRPTALAITTTGGSSIHQRPNGEFQVTGRNSLHEDYVMYFRPKDLVRITGMRLRVLPDTEARGKLSLEQQGHVILTNLKISIRKPRENYLQKVDVDKALADHEGEKKGSREYGSVADVLDDDPRTGWSTDGSDPTEPRTAVFSFAEPVTMTDEEELVIDLRHRSLRGFANMRRYAIEFTDEAAPASHSLDQTPLESLAAAGNDFGTLAEDQQNRLREQFFADRQSVVRARERVRRAAARVAAYEQAKKPLNVMVLGQRDEARPTHVLVRGVWDKPGEAVTAGTPAVLSAQSAEPPQDRLGLAKWLVDRSNPLTARVAVNRYWQMYFGAGLVRTPEDFGVQGEPPTHPDLLDWLAVEFMDSGWNVKHMQRLIVTSATYRQSSAANDSLRARDPENRLLARASRFRLPSWMIRDSVLSSCGLLDARLGGPPVYPYQPPGAWLASTMGRFRYEPSVGSDRYRRSLYTFWRRSVIPTGMFDAAGRLVCQVRTVRTNTPLHSLVLMNDQSFIEAAKHLAHDVLQEFHDEDPRIDEIFLRILSRHADDRETAALRDQLRSTSAYYQDHPEEADKLVGLGQYTYSSDPVELASYTVAVTTVLNLDEAMTRE